MLDVEDSAGPAVVLGVAKRVCDEIDDNVECEEPVTKLEPTVRDLMSLTVGGSPEQTDLIIRLTVLNRAWMWKKNMRKIPWLLLYRRKKLYWSQGSTR